MFPSEPLPDRVGTYTILRRLPSSGAAEVLLARTDGPRGFQRECALKLMLDTSDGSAGFAEELAREAAICARLNHPAIVRVFDFFEHGPYLVLVLEHVGETTLEQIVHDLAQRHRRLGDAAIFYLGSRIAGALTAAHMATDENGAETPIIHRNLSPENVLVCRNGDVRLTGFGVGKILGRTPDTAIGTIKGTPGFMAPEQARGEAVTTKTDVYGLGLLLWSLLSGKRPPADGSFPRRLGTERSDLPREVGALIEAALDPSPATRRITAREIEQWLAKAAPAGKGREELKDRVTALREERGILDSSPDRSVGEASQRIPVHTPPIAASPGGRGHATPPAGSRLATEDANPAAFALSSYVRNLPPARPVDLADRGSPAPVRAATEPWRTPAPLGSTAVMPTFSQEGTPLGLGPVRFGPPPEAEPPLEVPAVLRFGAPPLLPPASAIDMQPRGALSPAPPNAVLAHEAGLAPVAPSGPRRGGFATPTPGIATGVPSGTRPAPEGLVTSTAPYAAPIGRTSASPPMSAAESRPPREQNSGSRLLTDQRRPLSSLGTILVSSITASIIAAAGMWLMGRHDESPSAATTSAAPGPASAIAASAPPSIATVTASHSTATPSPPNVPSAPTADVTAAALAATPPTVAAADLPYGYGYLTVSSSKNATVYLSGKAAGPVNRPLRVRCGRWYARLAAIGEGRFPTWVSAGETVAIACQGSTQFAIREPAR